jgi:hypothetical protein
MGRRGGVEVGIETRRRPIGRDYAAAKDAEGGIKKEAEMGKTGKGREWETWGWGDDRGL